MLSTTHERNLRVDTLRGVACILLVAFHAIGSEPTNGLKIASGFYRDVNDILAYLRMPLFTFLSGFVYAYRPFKAGATGFLAVKARRLLLPMLTVGTVFALIQRITPGTNTGDENLYLIHIIPVAHYWFVESLFLLFLLVVVLELLHLFDKLQTYLIVFLIASLLYISPLDSRYFSFSGFIYLSPYFLLGMGLKRYRVMDTTNTAITATLVIISIAFLVATYLDIIPIYGKRTLQSLAIGSMSCVALLFIGFRSELLAKIGAFSYTIYLFHVFFTSSTRIVLDKVAAPAIIAVFIVSVILGIIGPIVVDLVLAKSNFTRIAFLGKSPIRMQAVSAT